MQVEFCKVFQKDEIFFREISFALYTVGSVTGDEGKLKANRSCLNLSNECSINVQHKKSSDEFLCVQNVGILARKRIMKQFAQRWRK